MLIIAYTQLLIPMYILISIFVCLFISTSSDLRVNLRAISQEEEEEEEEEAGGRAEEDEEGKGEQPATRQERLPHCLERHVAMTLRHTQAYSLI